MKRLTIKQTDLNAVFIVVFIAVVSMCICSDSKAENGVYSTTAKERYCKPLILPEIDDQQLIQVTLTDEIYAACELDFSDIRLIDSDSSELPYVIRQAFVSETDVLTRHSAVKIASLIESDNGSIEVTVDVPKDHGPVAGIKIHSALKDFERIVTVLGKQPGSDEPFTLVDHERIYDFSRFADVRMTEIRFKQSSYSEITIRIENVTEYKESEIRKLSREFSGLDTPVRMEEEIAIIAEPFRINGIELISETVRQKVIEPVRKSYDILEYQIVEDDEHHQSVISIATYRQPLKMLHLHTTSRNFNRPVIAQHFHRDGWNVLGTYNLFNLSYQDIHEEKLDMTFSESRSPEYRIVISNADNSPLEITGISATGWVYQLVFLARSGQTCHVCYGNLSGKPPSYDTAAITSLISKGFKAKAGELGPAFSVPNPDPPRSRLHFINSKWFFGIAVIVMVIIMAFILFQTLKRQDI